MIPINEIRFNNYFLLFDEIKQIGGVTTFDSKQGVRIENTWYDLKYLHAIPLTPEILLRFGFTKTTDKPYKDCDAFIYGKDANRLIWSNGEVFKPSSSGGFYRLGQAEFIHQLQNAWTFLTGAEAPNLNLIL